MTDSSYLEAFVRDTRFALRRLVRDWRFSVAAVLILGIGIGANAAIFSFVNAARFRHAALPEPDRLVDIYQRAANPDAQDAASYPAYADIAEAGRDLFSAVMATSVPRGVTWLDRGELRSAVAEHASASYMQVLGLRMTAGRWFLPEDDVRGAPLVVVVGHGTWTRQFGADPRIVGRTVRVDGLTATIVGVAPAGHTGTLNTGIITDFWLPIESMPAFGMSAQLERRPDESGFLVKARLRPAVTVAQAQAAMDILGRRLAEAYPALDPGKGIRVIASEDVWVHPQLDAPLKAAAAVMLALVGMVLVIACSNLATLLLVRGAARQKDMAIRLAIGAPRGRLIRQLLTESMLLSVAGGALGCLLAWWSIRAMRAVELPIAVDLALDGRVLAFVVAVSAVTAILCGLAPALSATRVNVPASILGGGVSGGGGDRRFTLRNSLIVGQISLSVLLLGVASLFMQWANAEYARPVGHAVDGVAMLEVDPRFSAQATTQVRTTFDELERRVAGLPGVEGVALTRGVPMQMNGRRVLVEGDVQADASDATGRPAGAYIAGPGFLATLAIPVTYGRALDSRDVAGAPLAAVVNESMAKAYFGTVNAVGRRFRLATAPGAWMEVVGVARDVGPELLDPLPYAFYVPFAQSDAGPTTIIARSSGDARALLAAMRRELHALDPTLPVVRASTMAQQRAEASRGVEAMSTALTAAGALGMLLAGIGLYAVIALTVTQRTREIGIRIAIGAGSMRVVWGLVRGVAALLGVGATIGLGLSVAATIAVRGVYSPASGLVLYRPSVDPVAMSAIVAVILAVGIAAAFVPARRAVRLDPMVALRGE